MRLLMFKLPICWLYYSWFYEMLLFLISTYLHISRSQWLLDLCWNYPGEVPRRFHWRMEKNASFSVTAILLLSEEFAIMLARESILVLESVKVNYCLLRLLLDKRKYVGIRYYILNEKYLVRDLLNILNDDCMCAQLLLIKNEKVSFPVSSSSHIHFFSRL